MIKPLFNISFKKTRKNKLLSWCRDFQFEFGTCFTVLNCNKKQARRKIFYDHTFNIYVEKDVLNPLNAHGQRGDVFP